MAKCRYTVYNAEIFCGLWTPIRTSDSTAEAKFKKSVFLGHPTAQCTYHMEYFIGGHFAEPAVRVDVYFIPMISTLFNQLPPWGDPPTNVCNLGRCIYGKFVAVWIF